ncbi:MAG: hypothetical protein HY804_08715, partial [Nitrospinae bacterium]|nr:hypothetical protein [Nitrospinota bacterium]
YPFCGVLLDAFQETVSVPPRATVLGENPAVLSVTKYDEEPESAAGVVPPPPPPQRR